MADWGTVTRIADISIVSLKAANDFSQIDIGINFGFADHVFELDLPPLAVPPLLGQLWPRGMVGPYYANKYVPGTAKLFNLSQDVAPPPNNKGQLWPRGDFIPSSQVVIIISSYGNGPYGHTPYGV